MAPTTGAILVCYDRDGCGMDEVVVSWKISDVIYFEWFLAEDSAVDDATLRARDAGLAAGISEPGGAPVLRDRKDLFRVWLEARRSEVSERAPGEYFSTAWQLLSVLSALFGAGLGVSVAAALLLAYRGDEPVNVGWFFACTVGIQWLILVAALLIALVRRTTHLLDDFRPLRNLLSGVLWSLSTALQQLPGEQRERMRARMAGLRRKSDLFQLLVWPLLMITQIFGVFFNAGVLVALLLPLGRDVAFGWQSTLPTSPEAVYGLVSTIAAPWSFLPNAHPSYEEVVQSRFSYSEGITSLSLPATTSWWPFLLYATIFYGLLVRLLLLVWCSVGLRVALRRYSFQHAGHHALLRRLTGPMIRGHLEKARLEVPASLPVLAHQAGGRCLALMASELGMDAGEVELGLRTGFGWELSQPVLSVRIDDPSGNPMALERIKREAASLAGIAVLVGARRAPIRAIALVLRKIADCAGGDVEVLVLLVPGGADGRPEPPTLAEELGIWRNFLAIHDLHAGLETWPQ